MIEKAQWCSRDEAIKKIRQLHHRSDLMIDAFNEASQNPPEYKAWKWSTGAKVYGTLVPEQTIGLFASRQYISLIFYNQPLPEVVDLLVAGQTLKQDAFISQGRKTGFTFELNINLDTRLAMEYTAILAELSHKAYNRTLGLVPLPPFWQDQLSGLDTSVLK